MNDVKRVSQGVFALSRRKLVLIITVIAVGSVPIYYLASPLFFSRSVMEGLPQTGSTVLAAGSFTGADSFHSASGVAKVLRLADGSLILRLEGFSATNGPDLYVYVSADTQARDFLSLGRLKGNLGDQNYDLPANVDLSSYKYVLVWCQAFRVLFGSAQLV